MRILAFGALATRVACVVVPLSLGPEGSPATGIEVLTSEIRGKQPDEVRALIIRRFGPPNRTIGSGFQIEQWDVEGGVLTFHPARGPTFDKGGVQMRLVRTTNLAADCLFGRYGMATLPDPAHQGTTYWLGSVSLSADARYRYKDSGQNLDHRGEQFANFFMLNPSGSARVEYAPGVTPETRLEDLPDGSPVATVTFTGETGRSSKSYRAVAYRTAMRLAFESEGAMLFRLDRAWVNYWR